MFPTYQWSLDSKSWKTAAVMGGVYVSASNKKFRARNVLMIGVAKAWMPAMTLKGIQDSTAYGGYVNLIQAWNEKTNATTFTAMIGTGGAFRLTDKFFLNVNLDYWWLKPTFTLVENVGFAQHLVVPGVYTLSNAGYPVVLDQATRKYSQAMNSINLTVGVSMKL